MLAPIFSKKFPEVTSPNPHNWGRGLPTHRPLPLGACSPSHFFRASAAVDWCN